MKNFSRWLCLLCCLFTPLWAQSLGSTGTIEGTVVDQTGASVPNAAVSLVNRISGYRQSVRTDNSGMFRLTNVPPNPYHLEATAANFGVAQQDVTVRTNLPIALKLTLPVAGGSTSVTVEGGASDVIENVPYQHNDVDRALYSKLPAYSPGSALSDAITFSAPGVVYDSNGFFHPLGDHAQTSYVIDGQPINDQQSKAFSTQIPLNAIQSMEVVTGMPSAEYGDKTSLVVNATTRSGLNQKTSGSFVARYGSFGTYGEEATLGVGNAHFGNFLVVNTIRSGRFLDTPEFWPVHDSGNNGTIFDRFDWQPNGTDSFHLDLFTSRNWFQVPNQYDQAGQDQRQRVMSFNIAPGYQHTFGAHTILTLNPFVRKDQVHYYPSSDASLDTPATLSQSRQLLNYGLKADLAHVTGRHSLKFGAQIMQTRLRESFSLGITDPSFNPVCVDGSGNTAGPVSVTDPNQCGTFGASANPDLITGLVPYDLSRGGSPFLFNARGHVNQYAVYVTDTISLGNLTLFPGLRVDQYNGPASDTLVQPRVGASYQLKKTGTVLRGAYSRTMETPYNENLLLSSATGYNGLSDVFGAFAAQALKPGHRNQYNVGFQQAVGRYLIVDADYFWKFTDRAFDFDVLFNTPVAFPIEWRKAKLDGVSFRVSTANLHGFQAYTTMGHTRARFFGPEDGGLIFNSPVNNAVFRIDHDQAFEQTTNVRYQRGRDREWIAMTWRYDSGLVAGSVPDLASALALSPDQQAIIGFFCGGQRATLTSPITTCDPSQAYGATRLRIPKEGTENDDTNPPRISPHHIFDVSVGTDNLLRTEKTKTTLRFSVLNVTNNAALFNFLSTFSGTHWITPRSYQAEVGFSF